MKNLKIGDRVLVDNSKGTIIEAKWNLYRIKFDSGEKEWIVNAKVHKIDNNQING